MFNPRRVVRTDEKSVIIYRWGFLKEGRLIDEYLTSSQASKRPQLPKESPDFVSFPECSFSVFSREYNFEWRVETLGLLKFKSYEDWLRSLKKKQRRMLTKAKSLGVETRLRRFDEVGAEAIYSLYHEEDSRQGMKFLPFYQYSREVLRYMFLDVDSKLFVVSYLNNKLVGFLSIRVGDEGGMIETLLTTAQRVPGVSNSLIECAVKELSSRGKRFLIYGHMGYMSDLDKFKIHNGFRPLADRRYYVPLNHKGAVCVKMRLCLEPWDLIPKRLWTAIFSLRQMLTMIFAINPVPTDEYAKVLTQKNGLS